MAVNINGQFYCARRTVPLLKAAGDGSIINIVSTAGLFGYPLRSPYAATSIILRSRHDQGINHNCPGWEQAEGIDVYFGQEVAQVGDKGGKAQQRLG